MQDSKATVITLAVLFGIVLLGVLFIYLLGIQQDRRELENSAAAKVFEELGGVGDYLDLEGKPLSLDKYLGQVLVVTSWASWSPASRTELNLLIDSVVPYEDEDVQLLAINRAEPEATAKSYLQSIGVAEDVIMVVDTNDRYYKQIQGFTMPETLFYNRKGNVVAHKRGTLTAAEVKNNIEKALASE